MKRTPEQTAALSRYYRRSMEQVRKANAAKNQSGMGVSHLETPGHPAPPDAAHGDAAGIHEECAHAFN